MAEEVVVTKCSFCITPLRKVARIVCTECTAIVCIQCFQYGAEGGKHKRGHNYEIRYGDEDVKSLFHRLWERDEEQDLIQTVHRFKLGNWEEVTKVITKDGKRTRNAADVSKHFHTYFVLSTLGQTAMKEKEWIERRDQFKDDISKVIADPSGRELYYHAVIEALRGSQEKLPDHRDKDIVKKVDKLVKVYFANLAKSERKRKASEAGAALSKSRAPVHKESFPYGESDDDTWWDKMFKQPREKKEIDRYYEEDNVCTEEKCMAEAVENEDCDLGGVLKMMKEVGLENNGTLGDQLLDLSISECGDAIGEEKKVGSPAHQPINLFRQAPVAKRLKMIPTECGDRPHLSVDMKREVLMEAVIEDEQQVRMLHGKKSFKATMQQRDGESDSGEAIDEESDEGQAHVDEEDDDEPVEEAEEEEEEAGSASSATQSDSDAASPAYFDYERYETRMREAGYETEDLYSDWDEENRAEMTQKVRELFRRHADANSKQEDGSEKVVVEGLEESADEDEEEEDDDDVPCSSKTRKTKNVSRRSKKTGSSSSKSNKAPRARGRPKKVQEAVRRVDTDSSDDEARHEDESVEYSGHSESEDSTSSSFDLVSEHDNEADQLDTLFGVSAMRRPKQPKEKKKKRARRTVKFYELGSDDEYHTIDEDAVGMPMVEVLYGRERSRSAGRNIIARLHEYYDYDPASNRYLASTPRPTVSNDLESEISLFEQWERVTREGHNSRSPARSSVTPALVEGDVDMDRTPEARFGDDCDPIGPKLALNESFSAESFQKYLLEQFQDDDECPSSPCESLDDEMGEQLMEYLGDSPPSDEPEVSNEEEEEEVGEEQKEIKQEDEDEEVPKEGGVEERVIKQEDEDPIYDESKVKEEPKELMAMSYDELMKYQEHQVQARSGDKVPKKEEPDDDGYPTAVAPATTREARIKREIKSEEPDEFGETQHPVRARSSSIKDEPLDEEEGAVAKERSEQSDDEDLEQEDAATEEEEDSDVSEELEEQPPVSGDGALVEEAEDEEDEEDDDEILYKLAEEQTEEDEEEEDPEDWNDDEFHGDHCGCRNCKYDRGEELEEEECEDEEEAIGDDLDEEEDEEDVGEEEETESDDAVECIRGISGLDIKCICHLCTRKRWSQTLGEKEHDLWRKIMKSGMNLEDVKKTLKSHFVQEESDEPSSESDDDLTDDASEPEEVYVKASKISDHEWKLDLSSPLSPIRVERIPRSRAQLEDDDEIEVPNEELFSSIPSYNQQEASETRRKPEKMEIVDESRPSSSKSSRSQPATVATSSSSNRRSSKSSQPTTSLSTESLAEIAEGQFDKEDEDLDKTPPMLQSDEKKADEDEAVVQPVEVPKTPIMVIKKVHARGRTKLEVETRPRTPQVPVADEDKKEQDKIKSPSPSKKKDKEDKLTSPSPSKKKDEVKKTPEIVSPPPPKKKKISKEFQLLFKDLEIRKWEESQAKTLKERATKAVGTSREKYTRNGTAVNVSDDEREHDPRKKNKKKRGSDQPSCSKSLALTPEAPVHEELPRSSRRVEKAHDSKRKSSGSPKKKGDKKNTEDTKKTSRKRVIEPEESEKEESSGDEDGEGTNGSDGKEPTRKRRKNKRIWMSKKERKAKWDKKIQNKKAREEKRMEEKKKKKTVRTVEFFEQHERTYFTNVYRRIAFDYEDHGFRPRVNFKSWSNDIYNMGYSQERDDLEVEYYNDAEKIISRLNITNTDGGMPIDMENEIKLAKVDRYMRVLQERRAARNQAAEYESIPDFLQLCRRMNNERRKLKDIVRARAEEESLEGKLTTILSRDELNEMKAARTRLLKLKARTEKLKELHESGVKTLEGNECLARFNPRTKNGRNDEQKKISERERGTLLVFDEQIASRLEKLSLTSGHEGGQRRRREDQAGGSRE